MNASFSYADQVAAEIAQRYGLAVKSEVFQRVPVGVSGLPQPVWDGSKLTYPEFKGKAQGAAFKERGRRISVTERRRGAALDPKVVARRARLAELHMAGATDAELSTALAVSVETVRKIRKSLLLPPNNAIHKRAHTVAEIRKRRLADLFAQGFTRAAMMADMGIGPKVFAALLRETGIRLPRPEPRPCRSVTKGERPSPNRPQEQRRAEREVLLRQMVAEGRGQMAIRSALGVSHTTYVSMMDRLGLERIHLPAMNAARHAKEARMARLAAMDVSQRTVEDLANEFGVTRNVMRIDLRQLGKKAALSATRGMSVAEQAAMEARRSRIAAMVAEGAGRGEILKAEQIVRTTLVADLKALGLTITRKARDYSKPCNRQSPEVIGALCDIIRRMRAEGKTLDEIAVAVGRSQATVSYHLKRLGLRGQGRRAGLRPSVMKEAA